MNMIQVIDIPGNKMSTHDGSDHYSVAHLFVVFYNQVKAGLLIYFSKCWPYVVSLTHSSYQ